MEAAEVLREACNSQICGHPQSPQKIGFLLMPSFSMMALGAATEPLRVANHISGDVLYSWHLFSISEESARSSSGFALSPEAAVNSLDEVDQLFVVATLECADYANPRALDWLRRFSITGRPIGAIGFGAMVLERAGLLNGYKCPAHYESLSDHDKWLGADARPDHLYCIDRNRSTCGGGTAAMHLMLNIIAREHGSQLAEKIANQVLHTGNRTHGDDHGTACTQHNGVTDRRITKAVKLMDQNIEVPISASEIASQIGVSSRQFERLWQKHFKESPSRFYLERRLKVARKMIQASNLSMFEIAFRCGFYSTSHLGRYYKQLFNLTPGEERHRKGRSDLPKLAAKENSAGLCMAKCDPFRL